MESTVDKYNHLIKEKSPYLLQHAYNPVEWYPWGNEAFKRAKEEDKPIFLSIGYSTCHWCHVMAHESFEDDVVAELINNNYIAIKVDREERPDLDNIYMTVCQMITGQGGWPLTIVMTPEKEPFYAATYIPRESKWGRTGLIDLLPYLKNVWDEDKEKVLTSASEIKNNLRRLTAEASGEELPKNILDQTYKQLEAEYDYHYGGFGSAPKFPIPHQLIFLLHYWQNTGNQKALEMVEATLLSLRAGGIYDQLGFGFHRYSTDKKWLIPHFEKMLYDQALLGYAYIEAYQATSKDIYKQVVAEIIKYTIRVMQSSQGGFFSAEDADSEGIEGKFYLWEETEIKALISNDNLSNDFIKTYHVQQKGNTGTQNEEFINKNILHLKNPVNHRNESLLAKINHLEYVSEILFKEREKRIHPDKDDKILTDWNGLMIAFLARASFVMDREDYLKMAIRCVDFIFDNLYKEHVLFHRYRDGETAITANLDDYAFLIWGLIELYQASFQPIYLKRAIALSEDLLNAFWDDKDSGFYFTSVHKQDLLIRSKEIYDGAIPSGNSVALWNLIRLAHLTGNQKYEDYAEKIITAFSNKVKKMPVSYCQFMIGFNALVNPYYDLVIVGDFENRKTRSFIYSLRKTFSPNLSLLLLSPSRKKAVELTDIAPFLQDFKQINQQTTAYLCRNYNCNLPTTEVTEVLEELKMT